MPTIVTNRSTERSGLPIAHAPRPIEMIPAISPIHQPRTCVCVSEITTSNTPLTNRYHATNTDTTTNVGPGHAIVAIPAPIATMPPTISNTRQPPDVTAEPTNNVSAPSQKPIEIRIISAAIDAGRSDSTMNPKINQRIPATRNNHQCRAYERRTSSSSMTNAACMLIGAPPAPSGRAARATRWRTGKLAQRLLQDAELVDRRLEDGEVGRVVDLGLVIAHVFRRELPVHVPRRDADEEPRHSPAADRVDVAAHRAALVREPRDHRRHQRRVDELQEVVAHD